jgi:hypothetical protein
MQDSSSEESADLGRYRQAADVAYKYAKSRLSKKENPEALDKEESDINENIKQIERS